jgi:hypothetical protein
VLVKRVAAVVVASAVVGVAGVIGHVQGPTAVGGRHEPKVGIFPEANDFESLTMTQRSMDEGDRSSRPTVPPAR